VFLFSSCVGDQPFPWDVAVVTSLTCSPTICTLPSLRGAATVPLAQPEGGHATFRHACLCATGKLELVPQTRWNECRSSDTNLFLRLVLRVRRFHSFKKKKRSPVECNGTPFRFQIKLQPGQNVQVRWTPRASTSGARKNT
jgi:hypothetical protein